MASLEARVEKLEKKLASLSRRRESVAMFDSPVVTPKPGNQLEDGMRIMCKNHGSRHALMVDQKIS